MLQQKLKVISASRRLDMVGGYPDLLAEVLQKRCPPKGVHTLVLWTKNASNLFNHKELSQRIRQYSQLFVHYTVTGMGGSSIEPFVPDTEQAMSVLPDLIKLVGSPRRIRFRFDPIVHFVLPDGDRFSNLHYFETLAPRVGKLGITDVSISWMSAYIKVVERLRRHQIETESVSEEMRAEEAIYLERVARDNGLAIHWCCVPEFPLSRCIDGDLLNELHPLGWKCSTEKAGGQRQHCGCMKSWDIGWYHKCKHGCLYCYGNPVEKP
ncbi:DUF1848 family protein [candidate division KSB1 bacterium]|nr:DUF1848 family protein [candidate division KSB1 bacterium]